MDKPTGQSSFDTAAQLLGHDSTSAVGAENARHDHRVWDLLDHIDNLVAEASATTTAYRRTTRVTADIAAARAAIRNSRTVRP